MRIGELAGLNINDIDFENKTISVKRTLVYQKYENGIRLVLLDEAFSKMTSDRIKPMMKMFRQMDLQVLLITTVEKASAIQPMCDVTYSIVKSGSRNSVAPFYLEVSDDGV